MSGDKVRVRLLHDNAPPVHDTGEPYLFGLQDKDQNIIAGTPRPGGGVVFDLELAVKDEAGKPNFTGPFAAGPKDDRFVYLSWKAAQRPGYINRIKAKLSPVTWDQVKMAQATGKALVVDMTGRRPHDISPVMWGVA